MSYLKPVVKVGGKLILVFAGLLTVLSLFQMQALKHGLMPVIEAGGINQGLMIFNVLALIPLSVLFFWPYIDRRWPGLYIAAIKINGVRYLVDLTRLRAAFIASFLSLGLGEVLL